jgi:hypothetical protein
MLRIISKCESISPFIRDGNRPTNSKHGSTRMSGINPITTSFFLTYIQHYIFIVEELHLANHTARVLATSFA